MKLRLENCTLVLVETREHALARLALEDCLRVATFDDVLVLSDRPEAFEGLSTRTHKVPDFPSKLGWSRSWWFDVPPLLQTAYTLNIQWDSWIWDITQWSEEFLTYDFVGSPWWYKDGLNVGNGGFSLVSTRLKRFLRDRRLQFPCDTSADDDLLCRKYRPALQDLGFTWAPEKVAHRFAFECARPSPTSKHFGFHACTNFPEVLSKERLLERARLMAQSKYITGNDYMWKAFCAKVPNVVRELTGEAQLRSSS